MPYEKPQIKKSPEQQKNIEFSESGYRIDKLKNRIKILNDKIKKYIENPREHIGDEMIEKTI